MIAQSAHIAQSCYILHGAFKSNTHTYKYNEKHFEEVMKLFTKRANN